MNSGRHRRRNVLVLLVSLYIIAVLISFSSGRYPIGPGELLRILLSKVFPIEKTWSAQAESVVFILRLPRIGVSSLIGAGLALSGLIYQIIFRNTSAGAGFGAAIALLLGLNGMMVSASAFLMGLIAVFIVWKIGMRIPGNQVLGLILGGIMISSIFQSATSFVKLVADPENELPAITYFLMGSLAGAGMDELKLIIIPMIVAAVPMLLLSWHLNIMALPEEEALSLGVNTRIIRAVAVTSSSLMTASAVAVSGMIGWVGLVIPHITRMTTTSDARTAVPASMILGATFLTLVDTIARNIATTEVPIGILTSFVGAPFFLYLIIREGKR